MSDGADKAAVSKAAVSKPDVHPGSWWLQVTSSHTTGPWSRAASTASGLKGPECRRPQRSPSSPGGSEARPVLEDAANVVQEELGHLAPGISVTTSCFQLKHGEEIKPPGNQLFFCSSLLCPASPLTLVLVRTPTGQEGHRTKEAAMGVCSRSMSWIELCPPTKICRHPHPQDLEHGPLGNRVVAGNWLRRDHTGGG